MKIIVMQEANELYYGTCGQRAFLSTQGLRTLLDSSLKPRSNALVLSNL